MTPDERIIYFFDHLKREGYFRFKEQIYERAGLSRQACVAIASGKRRFTTHQVARICDSFNVNANWIFGVEANMFRVNKIVNKVNNR